MGYHKNIYIYIYVASWPAFQAIPPWRWRQISNVGLTTHQHGTLLLGRSDSQPRKPVLWIYRYQSISHGKYFANYNTWTGNAIIEDTILAEAETYNRCQHPMVPLGPATRCYFGTCPTLGIPHVQFWLSSVSYWAWPPHANLTLRPRALRNFLGDAATCSNMQQQSYCWMFGQIGRHRCCDLLKNDL